MELRVPQVFTSTVETVTWSGPLRLDATTPKLDSGQLREYALPSCCTCTARYPRRGKVESLIKWKERKKEVALVSIIHVDGNC